MGQRIGCLWLGDRLNTPDGCFTFTQNMHELNTRSCCYIGSMHVWHCSSRPSGDVTPALVLANSPYAFRLWRHPGCTKWTQGLPTRIKRWRLQPGSSVLHTSVMLSLLKRIRSNCRVSAGSHGLCGACCSMYT